VSLRPLAREFIPRPKGLHRATYRRLLRAHGRIVAQLERLPSRRLWPVVRKRLQTELQNRLKRVRRRLGLRVPHPPARRWYRTSEAAAFVGVSSKTLLRWTARGRVPVSARPGVTANAAIAIAISCASFGSCAFEGRQVSRGIEALWFTVIIGGISIEEDSSGRGGPDCRGRRRAAGT